MRMAILYFCVGKYDILWEEFYRSCEKYFCAGHEKHYFVFTDSIKISSGTCITKIHQDNLGWPFISLYRYRVFNKIQNQLEPFDYIVFFNANLQFLQPITKLEFFGNGSKSLVACQHPGFYNKEFADCSFERKVESTACIKSFHSYFQGAINGGKSREFLIAIQKLVNQIEQDIDNGVMAVWYDESHWNAYINNNFENNYVHVLSPAYLYPEGWDIPFEQIIIQRDINEVTNKTSEKKLIVVNCLGGLGNQMFQYAFYCSLKALGVQAKFNISGFKEYTNHNGYMIERVFSIKPEYATDLECEISENITQQNFGYNEEYIKYDGLYYIDGYWQSEKYFLNCIDRIRNDFIFPVLDENNNLIAKKIQHTNSISIHIRRGDYVDHPLHGGICSLEYYNKAIELIKSKVNSPTFYIFSNDIEWCRDNLKVKTAVYINGNQGENSYKDMHLMSLCKYNIIANSSFSWWGAWLNMNPDKIIIAPNRWFNDDKINIKDLVPDKWIKLDC